ncbi:MAG: hypothetical protein HYR71_10890, partial [Chloroflexi bacterium]|nr:hypothetical protein [Chloroflexota bacterium]
MGGPQVTPASRSRVDDLMARMTLEQKVGQVMMIGFDGTALPTDLREMIEQYFIGGVILYERNVESPRALAQLDADMQNAAQQNGQPGLFISIDQEGGIVARLKEEKGF